MATSSRPRRNVNRRSLDYHEGLLHEEELAIRRALQASLHESKTKIDEPQNSIIHPFTPSPSKQNIGTTNHNKNHFANNKPKKKRKKHDEKQDNEQDNDRKFTTASPKKIKLNVKGSLSSRSRSSSLNSLDSINSSSSNSKNSTKTVSSTSSQTITKSKCSKVPEAKATVKIKKKKEKLGVKIRKKLMKKKLRAARNGSDDDSTVSGSTNGEVVTLKTRRAKKRKGNTLIQKKFASFVPSPSKSSAPLFEIDTSEPLAKAEDFIDFLCLRGHPQMPKNLEVFNNPFNSPSFDEDFPCSPPSSSISELPSSPSPSLPVQITTDSPSCDTPVFDAPPGYDNSLHAMRMYAGIENKRKDAGDAGSKQEIAVADLEDEEEINKSTKSVTPPLSFRVSPRPTPPLSSSSNTNGSKIFPSPSPRMTMSPSSTTTNPAAHASKPCCSTLDNPGFGPPPLMLGQGKGLGSGGCCSPPPLLYIPAAAQRVTHLHGPPKLERVHGTEGLSSVSDSPPLLTHHGQCSADLSNVEKQSASCGRNSKDNNQSSAEMPRQEVNEVVRPSSAVDFTTCTKNKMTKLSSDARKDDDMKLPSYTRNTKSCPLYNSSDISRIEKAKRDLNADTNSYPSGLPVSQPLTHALNTDITHVGHNMRSHDACTSGVKQSGVDRSALLEVDSPDSAISLGTNSLLENLQRAHDKISGLMSPSETGFKEMNNGGNLTPTSFLQIRNSGISQQSGSPNQTYHTSFSRQQDRNQFEKSYPRTSTVSEPSIGEPSGDISPFQPGFRHAFTPPWSHLHATYHQTASSPRPYTLSLPSPFKPDHATPRTIPIIPTNTVPVLSSSKHISIPFSEGFVQKACMNQTYSLPKAFEGPSTAKDDRKSSDVVRGTLIVDRVTCQSNGVDTSLDIRDSPTYCSRNLDSEHFDIHSPSSSPSLNNNHNRHSTKTHQINEDLNTENSPSSKRKKSHNQNTPDKVVSNSGKESSDAKGTPQKSESPLNSETKKRRGRPPGSKNKKTLALLEKGKQETQQNGIPETSESSNSKQLNGTGTKSAKKNKIECPILRPTDEEFKDPLSYLKSVRDTLEQFGICIIEPPESWKMESHLPGNPRFTSKRQLIHRLQKRWGPTEIKLACIEKHLKQQQSLNNLTQMPVVGGCDLDLAELSRIVMEHGGMQKVIDSKKWSKVGDLLKIPKTTQDRAGKLQDAYCKYLLSYDLLAESEKSKLEKEVRKEIDENGGTKECRNQCTTKGRSFSIGCFQRTARSFQDHFFKSEPSVNDVEREYWKIVQSRDKYVASHHGRLDTKEHGSCFPTSKADPYSKNGWNLNVLGHHRGTILKHAGNVQDLTIPWLNIEMLFSTKRWTTTPLQTYLIDYLHSSNDRVWYGVPESHMGKFPHVKTENTNNPEDGEIMVSPSNLSRETDIKVTRLEQKQGQFVVVSPKVFHCYVSSGYSVSETVSFAFPDWILRASTLDADLFEHWPGFSYEKLLLKGADEICHDSKESAECLRKQLVLMRDQESKLKDELRELGVKDSKPTSTTAKGIQTIPTSDGTIQVNVNTMYCVVCNRLCHLSSVLSEEDSELICLSHAVEFIREESPTEPLIIITNYSLTQLNDVISSVTNKIKKL